MQRERTRRALITLITFSSLTHRIASCLTSLSSPLYAHLSLRWSGLKTALQMSRKPFRFFKYLNEYLKFKKLVARPTLSEEGGREGEEVVEVKDKNALPLYKKVGMGGKIIGKRERGAKRRCYERI